METSGHNKSQLYNKYFLGLLSYRYSKNRQITSLVIAVNCSEGTLYINSV